ncbi:MAG: LysM peptidoglycan-binding domain-containing protein [Phototrophicaceae bacterium]
MNKSIILIGLVVLTFGCNVVSPVAIVPTVVNSVTPTATATHTPLPTTSPTFAPTETSIFLPTNTALPPTATPLPTATPGPYEHLIQPNQTLMEIVQLYGHRDLAVFNEVIRINDNVYSADLLPAAGTTILIPYPTLTPTVERIVEDGQSIATTPIDVQANALTTQAHIVREGETMVDIAEQYRTTLEILSQLNSPRIPFFGCNFELLSGGADCVISLQIGQEVFVPAPTPTPTLSPTPSGLETATPLPTPFAPSVIAPVIGSIVNTPTLALQWSHSLGLGMDEIYLVQLQDTTTGETSASVTRDTRLVVSADFMGDGQLHDIQWSVAIARRNSDGRYETIGATQISVFKWQG